MVLQKIYRILLAMILASAVLSGVVQPARAQTGSVRFETLSVEHGLSQSTVRAILQDSLGFMWFGTEDGLNKYDGYTFTLYKHDPENPSTLSNSTITAIFEDSNGELWFGTADGLNYFNRQDETFNHYLHDPANASSLLGSSVSAIAEDSQGNLWVTTTEGGLNLLDREEGSFTHYRHASGNSNTLINDQVNDMVADNSGGLWIGTAAGLDHYNALTGRFTHYQKIEGAPNSLSDNHVLSLFLDRANNLWVGTEEGGLNRLNTISGTFTRYRNSPPNPYTISGNFVATVYEDRAGKIWAGSRSGLNLLVRPDDYFIRYQHDPTVPHSLSNDYVLSIYEDRSGVLWIGTLGGGLSKYIQTTTDRFTLYQHRPGMANTLNNDIVHAVTEDDEGNVWVGTMDGGLNRLDHEARTFSAYMHNPVDQSSLSSNDVRAVFQDHLGILWLGTNGGGLNRFQPELGRFRRYQHESRSQTSISDNRVTVIYEDSRANLWVGTRSGLNLMDREKGVFTRYLHDPQNTNTIADDFVRAIYETSDGRLWIGTNNGISVMSPDWRTFTHYRNELGNPLSLGSNRVLSILETSDGTVWIGTMLGGLNRFDRETGTFHHYTQRQGLPSNVVYGILADRSGFLWVSTNRGLSRFDPQTETFRNYDRRDGLQSYEFNAGAYFQNSRGYMYFGGVQGFNSFDPQNVLDNPVAPPVVITAFKKFNQTEAKDLLGGEKIRLSYQDSFVSFEFAALDYSAPEKNQYAYKLEGFDKDWVYAGTRRYVSYTNLRGGTYIFRVIGSNQDGVWNETGATVEISVTPPIWERWWFIGTLGLLIAGSAVGGYRLREMRIQAQTMALEKQVRERTQEIERRRQVAEGLREILSILNTNRSLNESLDSIIHQIVRLMGAGGVVIFRCGEEGFPMIVATNVIGQERSPAGDRLPLVLPGWVTMPILQGQPLLIPNLQERLENAQSPASAAAFRAFERLLAVPLMVSDKVDGGVVILYEDGHFITDEDVKIATNFADHAALAVANAMLRSQAEEIAVSAERNRLARDLHDAVTQTLFATSLIAEVLPKLWERNPEAGKQKINEIRELTRGALAEMRTLLMELRPTALEDVPLHDLLQQLCEAFQGRARVPVTLEADRSLVLPSNVKLGFYRIAQESLNNIQKHARASQVSIDLRASSPDGENHAGAGAVLTICDNGIGFQPGLASPDHFGLGIMEERAQNIGAQFLLNTEPGSGTCIAVKWDETGGS